MGKPRNVQKYNYDHVKAVGCIVEKEIADKFNEYCRTTLGKHSMDVLKEYVISIVSGKSEV